MHYATTYYCCIALCFVGLVVNVLPIGDGNVIRRKALNVGEELWKETLPLQMGSCIYQINGLKPQTWYEVKISYPASIPARFDIQLTGHDSDLGLKQQRKLLNTEKLIFKSGDKNFLNEQGGMFVLVTVEPEGVVAIPHGREREDITFNIGNLPSSLQIWISETNDIQLGTLPVRLLGVPLISSKHSIANCEPLIFKVTNRISSWTNNFLSSAGRLQLIKSLSFAMVSFWQPHFILPNSVNKKFNPSSLHCFGVGEVPPLSNMEQRFPGLRLLLSKRKVA